MKNILKARKGFTLVELIVVIAIVAILSTIGFVSYSGYIKDSRATVRESNLAEIVNLVSLFSQAQSRLPKCADNAETQCDFFRATAADGTGVAGISQTDWDLMNTTKDPIDPRKTSAGASIHYVYAYSGTDFELAATREESSGYTAIVRGSKEDLGILTSTTSSSPVPTGKKDCSASGTNGKILDGEACIPYTF